MASVSFLNSLRGNTKGYRPLTRDELMRRTPSVFATEASGKTSGKYTFIPSIQAVEAIENQGYSVVSAMQSNARTLDGQNYARHMLRFRRNDKIGTLAVNDICEELIFWNAHDGSSAYGLALGMFRQACLNGLIVCDSLLASERVRHVGYQDSKIIEAQYRVIDSAPKMLESVKAMQSVTLNTEEKRALALSAASLKWDLGETQPSVERLLAPRRYEDKKDDLWTTFNVVQENVLKGGLRTFSRDERGNTRYNSTREVKSVVENKRLNQSLWMLAEEMKKLKGAA